MNILCKVRIKICQNSCFEPLDKSNQGLQKMQSITEKRQNGSGVNGTCAWNFSKLSKRKN